MKSPQKGLVRLAQELAGHLWLNEQHLKDLVNVLHQSEEFSRVKLYFDLSLRQLVEHEAERNLQLFVQSVYHYVVQLLGYRGRSLSKFNSPPDCYASLCLETADVTLREETKAKLTEDWKALRLLELSPGEVSRELSSDLGDTVSSPMRLVYQLYEVNCDTKALSILSTLVTVNSGNCLTRFQDCRRPAPETEE